MVTWREVFSKAVYLFLTTALPGYVIGVAVESGQAPYWESIACALVAWVVALAYGIQRKRVAGYKVAVVRMQAKQDVDVNSTYVIHPEETDG